MNGKIAILHAFALVLACSPVFAAESMPAGNPAQKKEPQTTQAAGKAKPGKASLRKVAGEEIGKEAVCPVTKEKFRITEKTLSASYKGKVYYFCCPGCDKHFIENPKKYLAKKPAVQAKVYACPMNDYQGDKPGKCPKCGMDLVEKK